MDEVKGYRQGILRVSYQLLASLLRMPDDARIVDISPFVYFSTNDLAIKVEHPDLPLTTESATLPQVLPEISHDGSFAKWDFGRLGTFTPRADGGADLVTVKMPRQLAELLGSNREVYDALLARAEGKPAAIEVHPGLSDEEMERLQQKFYERYKGVNYVEQQAKGHFLLNTQTGELKPIQTEPQEMSFQPAPQPTLAHYIQLNAPGGEGGYLIPNQPDAAPIIEELKRQGCVEATSQADPPPTDDSKKISFREWF